MCAGGPSSSCGKRQVGLPSPVPRPPNGAAAVEGPERQAEHDHVRQPDDQAAHQQLRPGQVRRALGQERDHQHEQAGEVPAGEEREEAEQPTTVPLIVADPRAEEEALDQDRLRDAEDEPDPTVEPEELPPEGQARRRQRNQQGRCADDEEDGLSSCLPSRVASVVAIGAELRRVALVPCRYWALWGRPCPTALLIRAGGGNRTLTTSLEGWGSTVELRPRSPTIAASPKGG